MKVRKILSVHWRHLVAAVRFLDEIPDKLFHLSVNELVFSAVNDNHEIERQWLKRQAHDTQGSHAAAFAGRPRRAALWAPLAATNLTHHHHNQHNCRRQSFFFVQQ